MDITKLSTKDLQAELLRRNIETSAPRVLPIDSIDFSDIKDIITGVRQDVIDGTYHEDDDSDDYLAQAVYKAFFGGKWYDWFNKNNGT